jgi:hypothetical protein
LKVNKHLLYVSKTKLIIIRALFMTMPDILRTAYSLSRLPEGKVVIKNMRKQI